MDLDVLNDKGLCEQPTTEVGSYFVANYPPFSVWSAAHVPAALRALDTPVTDASGVPRSAAQAPGEPGTLRKGKLEAIKAIGTTRLSRAGEHARWGLAPVTLIFTAATLALVCVSLVTRPPSAATLQRFFGTGNDAR
jgi:hypothetical protein